MIPEDFFVVGDVHGVAHALESALSEARTLDLDPVLVGDYIDRGPESMQVMELLCDAKEELGDRLILLRGNHEVMLLDFLDSGDPQSLILHGGLSTINSYIEPDVRHPIEHFRKTFPSRHRKLLESTEIYIETDEILISHAGLNPERPSSRTIDDMTLGNFAELFNPYLSTGKTLVVCGHYVQDQGKPYISDRLICLDTGCGTRPGAPLTAMLLRDRAVKRYEGTPSND